SPSACSPIGWTTGAPHHLGFGGGGRIRRGADQGGGPARPAAGVRAARDVAPRAAAWPAQPGPSPAAPGGVRGAPGIPVRPDGRARVPELATRRVSGRAGPAPA